MEDSNKLTVPMVKEELHATLLDMHPNKSPGSDGFNLALYHNLRDLCGNDILEAATIWLERGLSSPSLNDSNICLIPKSINPHDMKDLCHISSCNMVYKLVSKVLANRFKILLDKCVAGEKSIFMNESSILDNAMIAIEVIHTLRRMTKGSKAHLTLSVDISKAFDRVYWFF